MARNVRVVTGGYAPQDRLEALADAMTVRSLKSRAPQQGGPVQVAMSPWEGVAQLGEAFIANRLNKRVNELAKADHERALSANDQMIRQLAGEKAPRRLDPQGQPMGAPVEMPTNLDGRPMMLSDKAEQLSAAMAGMDPRAGNQVLSAAMLQRALAPPAAPKEVDLGDRIGLLDTATGKIVGELPKRATPDAQLREGGENARWMTPSGNAQLGAQTTMRGQDIGASTAMRGQDITARGQDISAETARRGQDLTAGGAATASAANPMGFNDRQLSGLSMQQNAAITYAANISGKTQDEIRRILATEGPDGVAKVINENGGRFIQGGSARLLQAVPLIGTPILEAMNADLIAPRTAGGAGIALVQNPSGPITTPDFQAGERQFPGPTYPLKDQANMVRDMLATPGQSAAPQASAPLTFATEAEAEAAGIQPGTKVIIGGVPGTWQ